MKKRISLTLGLAAIITSSALAQENIAPHVEELPQRINFNAALQPDNNVFFAVTPAINLGVENTGFCFDDLFVSGDDDSLRLDLNRLASKMKKTNFTSADLDLQILAFGIRLRQSQSYLSFFVGNKTMIESKFDRNITDIWKGNWDFDNNQPIQHHISNMFVRGVNYMEFAAGYSQKFPSLRMTFGLRAKFLAGVFAVLSDDLAIDFDTYRESDRYAIHMNTSGSIKTSLPVSVKLDEDGYVDELSMDDLSFSDANPAKNKGIAFDLGGTWQVFDQLKVGLSLVDVGFIKWNDGCNRFDASTSFTYHGVDISEDMKTSATNEDYAKEDDADSYWSSIKDSLLRIRQVSHSNTGFKTRLSSRLIATADYQPFKWLTAGATVATKFVDGQAFTRGSITALLKAPKVVTFAATFAVNPGFRPSPGLGLVLSGGPFQMYVIADRIMSNIRTSTGTSLSAGINFNLGRKKYALVRDANGY